VIYINALTGDSFVIPKSDAININKFYSGMDKFLYAPDNLIVEGNLITYNSKNGIIEFDFEHKIKLEVKNLVLTWTTVSDE
jgi:hypothetical protein